ncbi:hypothetical protein DDB_G0272911 [Dictyostelium discoideum AX4]|uniref:SAYSvFN domain-containing protein n=1 Tax=Dictyostelium discoideum TaxID=44689 RepID=Q559G9_DICDI|nr:hypothetical protein DDB_G0272911 [Dictyostelium discoideum AX4]EAL71093.1 hypothetical protein DDB_G0272911 [Dictyostelium discoideum AX4]|eukprot:XP_644847.1 hypothetical protein DDB_G0272911 [Dictyostelium discoideum AX4]
MFYDNIKYYQYSFREGFCSGNGINKISCIFGSSIFDGVGGIGRNGDDNGGGGGRVLRRRRDNNDINRIIGDGGGGDGDLILNEEDEFIDEVDIMCINFFNLKNFKKFFALIILQYLFVKFFGPVCFVFTSFFLIFNNLGKKKSKDEISAYSVFNKNHSNLVKGPNLIAINFV